MAHRMTAEQIEFAVEFLILGTNNENIFQAEETISASAEYQQCIRDEFGMEYLQLLDQIFQHYSGKVVPVF